MCVGHVTEICRKYFSCSLDTSNGKHSLKYNKSDGQTSDKILQHHKEILETIADHPMYAEICKVWELYTQFNTIQMKYLDVSLDESLQGGVTAREFYFRFTQQYGPDEVTPYIHIQGAHAIHVLGRKYPIGRMKNELIERWHRLMKDIKSNNGGSHAPGTQEAEDPLGLLRQFLVQYCRFKIIIEDILQKVSQPRFKWSPQSKALAENFFRDNDLRKVKELTPILPDLNSQLPKPKRHRKTTEKPLP